MKREIHWCLLLIILQVGNPMFCLKQQMHQQLCGAQPSLRGTAPWIPLSPKTVSGVTRLLHKIPFVVIIYRTFLFLDLNNTHIVFLFPLVFLCGLVGGIYFCYKRYKYVCDMQMCCLIVWNLTRLLFSLIPGGHQTRQSCYHQKRFPWMLILLRRLNSFLPLRTAFYTETF